MADQQLVSFVEGSKSNLIMPKLPQPIQDGYEWHNEDNRRRAVGDTEALWLSMQFGIEKQVDIYTEQLLDLFHKDNVDRVHDLVRQATGYEGHYYHRPETELSRLGYAFNELISEERLRGGGKVTRYYNYTTLNQYAQKIPLHALRAMHLLETHNIHPYQFWVATFIEQVQTPRLLPDPLLCVGFNLWVVSIAEWK